MKSFWVAFFRTYRSTLLVIWIAPLRIIGIEINDTLAIADEGIAFDDVQTITDSYDLATTIHVFWIA